MIRIAAWHALAATLVQAFAHTFELWRGLSRWAWRRARGGRSWRKLGFYAPRSRPISCSIMRLPSRSVSLAILAVVAGTALWVRWFLWPADPGPRWNVLVVTMESARAETLGLMPRTRELAKDATTFERHRAVSAWTGANVVALLSGVSPVAHGVHTRGQTIPEAWETPLDDLTRAGYAVAGLQGFMGVAGFASLGLALDTRIDLDNWLRARAEDKRPFFVWYHHPHTHLPYAPLPPHAPDWKALLPPGDDAAIDRVRHVTELPAIHAG
ncbi:MAG: hypothetical protein NBV67_16850, partial [Tagaea sp.]|nr:hypothetical protein [Tagaea sp.]